LTDQASITLATPFVFVFAAVVVPVAAAVSTFDCLGKRGGSAPLDVCRRFMLALVVGLLLLLLLLLV
jgi:hypothetical protein